MKLLADTEAVIRFAIDDLPAAARGAMSDEENIVFVSAASVWEIATKVRIGNEKTAPGTRFRIVILLLNDAAQAVLDRAARHRIKQAGSSA